METLFSFDSFHSFVQQTFNELQHCIGGGFKKDGLDSLCSSGARNIFGRQIYTSVSALQYDRLGNRDLHKLLNTPIYSSCNFCRGMQEEGDKRRVRKDFIKEVTFDS